MAAPFGSLGGLGGFGTSYPTRTGAPNSQVVMTDKEFAADWKRRLEEVPRYVQAEAASNRLDTDAATAGALYGMQGAPTFARPDADVGGMKAIASLLAGTGLSYNMDGTVGTSAYGDLGSGTGSHIVADTSEINPYYTSMENRMNAEIAARRANAARQQSAYDYMSGGGQVNGVLNDDYSAPDYGLITGRGTAAMPTTDMGWTSGIYNPRGGNTGLFGALSMGGRGWNL